jgi:hypothetical protein
MPNDVGEALSAATERDAFCAERIREEYEIALAALQQSGDRRPVSASLSFKACDGISPARASGIRFGRRAASCAARPRFRDTRKDQRPIDRPH